MLSGVFYNTPYHVLEHQLSRRRLIQTAGILASGAALTSFGVGCSGFSAEQPVSPELRPLAPGTITLVDWAESSNKFGQTQSRYPAWNELLLQYFEESRLNAAIRMAGIQGEELKNSEKKYGLYTAQPVFEQLYAADPQVALGIGLQYHLLNHGIKMRESMQHALSEFGYTADPFIIPAQDMLSDIIITPTDAEINLDMNKVGTSIEQHPSEVYSLSIQPRLRFSRRDTAFARDMSKQSASMNFVYITDRGSRSGYYGLEAGNPDCFDEMTIKETAGPGELNFSYINEDGAQVTLTSEYEYTQFIQGCERSVQQEVKTKPYMAIKGGYDYTWADETYGQTQDLASSFPRTLFVLAGGNFQGETLVHARLRRPSLSNTKYIGSGSFAGDGSFKPLSDIMGLDVYVPQRDFTGSYSVADGSSAATAKFAAMWGMCLQKGVSNQAIDAWLQEYGSEKVWHYYTDVLTRAPYVSTTLNVFTEDRVHEYGARLQPPMSRRTFLMR